MIGKQEETNITEHMSSKGAVFLSMQLHHETGVFFFSLNHCVISISEYEALSGVSAYQDDYSKDPVIMECSLSL